MDTNKDLDWMLWQVEDSDINDPPSANLIRAIQPYNQKYGLVPNRCEVAPEWAADLKAPGGMLISASKDVRPRHFLLTVDPHLKTTASTQRMLNARQ
ncbi:MAG: hypothetical protein FVQ83_03665 [Chloroflexi bacterium]|nr:hypothetical protein [Chloroflexota bacterium]